jgi:membrane fusion protein, multidrug efflux system
MTQMPGPKRNFAQAAVTLLVIALSIGAVIGGAGVIGLSSASDRPSDPVLMPVAAMRIERVQGYDVTRRFTGQIEAAARLDLGFEFGGRLTEVLAEEGDLVPAGAVLARLDTSALIPERATLEAELAALAADAELARLTLERNDRLTERGARPVAAQDEARLALARAQAGMAAIAARIAGVDVALSKSVLTAPFAVQVGARLADPGQTIAPGQSVLVVFDAAPARARVGLPPDLAAELRLGDTVTVEMGGRPSVAQISHIRPDLDPNTRSRAVIVTLAADSSAVLGDTVALILVQRVAEPGFWAPLSALREGVRGSWSVMTLATTAQGDRTELAAVEVIYTAGDRVFLRGDLADGARIVAQAPDRVAPGQPVLALME